MHLIHFPSYFERLENENSFFSQNNTAWCGLFLQNEKRD